MAINPEKNAVEQGLIARLIGKIKRIALDMGDSFAAETSRAQAAEAAAKTVVAAGENCSVTRTTASDGHDVYTVNADGKPQIPADWEQQDSGKPDYIKNKPNLGLKADKVQGATAGNLAALDANGNLTDSGKKAADFKTKQTAVADPAADGTGLSFVDSVTQNANGEITPHKKTVQDGTTAQKGVVKLNNAINSTSTTEAATPKAVKDAYDELNNKIVARAVFLSQQEWAVQSQLPGDPAKVYYVENGTGEDAYTVYVWKESTSEYVEVDESSIDLDGYWHDAPTTTGNGNVVTGITLGNDGVPVLEKGITALTQHQSVTDGNPTLAWGATSTVGTVGSTNLRVTMPSNPASGKQDAVSTDTDSSAFDDNTTIATGFSEDNLHLNVASRLWTYIDNKISSVLGLTASSYGGKAATAGTTDVASSVNATAGKSITSTGSNGSMEILNGALSSVTGGAGSCSIDGDGISFTQGASGSSMTSSGIATSGTGTFTGGVTAKGRPIDGSATILANASTTWNSNTTHLVINRSAASTTTIDLKNLSTGVVYWLHVPRDNIIALKNSSALSTFYCYNSSHTTTSTNDTYNIRSHINGSSHGGFSSAIVRSNNNFYVMMDY